MENIPDFEVIVGTYEEYLLGYKIKIINETLQMQQSFATHEHSSSLRTVTSHGKYLASGGADDRICVYDMFLRKEHVMLTTHNTTVNCLEFTKDNSHLISSSTDGVLTVTRCGSWIAEKLWEKAHKNGYVIALAVHPTGKLALTLGSDCTLQTWNLIKGRKAYIVNLNSKSTDAKSLSFLKWGPCGEKFILGGGNNVEIWNISSGGIMKAFKYEHKVTCATWLTDNFIVIGHENGKLTVMNILKETSKEYDAYSSRVKCLEYKNKHLITASSSGCIKLWTFSKKKLNETCETSTGCRITCITLVDGINVKKEENEAPENDVVEENNKIQSLLIQKPEVIVEEDSEEENVEVSEKVKEIINKNTDTSNFKTKKKKNKKKRSMNKEIKEKTGQASKIIPENGTKEKQKATVNGNFTSSKKRKHSQEDNINVTSRKKHKKKLGKKMQNFNQS